MNEKLRNCALLMDGKSYESWNHLKTADVENYKKAQQYPELLDKLIKKKIKKGAVKHLGENKPEGITVNPIGIAYPESENPRLVTGLKINKVCRNLSASLDHLGKILPNLYDANWQWKQDIKSCYDQISLSNNSQLLCGFKHKNQYYVFSRLPFGWAPAPYCVQFLFGQVKRYLRAKGFDISQYIDDFHNAESTEERATQAYKLFKSSMSRLGVLLGADKDSGVTQSLSFLGLDIDLKEKSVSGHRKLLKMRNEGWFLERQTWSRNCLERLCGKLSINFRRLK